MCCLYADSCDISNAPPLSPVLWMYCCTLWPEKVLARVLTLIKNPTSKYLIHSVFTKPRWECMEGGRWCSQLYLKYNWKTIWVCISMTKDASSEEPICSLPETALFFVSSRKSWHKSSLLQENFLYSAPMHFGNWILHFSTNTIRG
jgi:hypothetical protein